MTSIAYHHKSGKISVDSRKTCEGIILSDKALKIHKKHDIIIFCCGSVPDIEIFMECFPDINTQLNVSGMMIIEAKANVFTVTEQGEFKKWKADCDYACGSGEDFAIAALDFGQTSKQAIEYAMTRDTHTGGQVRTIRLDHALDDFELIEMEMRDKQA